MQVRWFRYSWLYHVLFGLKEGYPVCCVLRWTFSNRSDLARRHGVCTHGPRNQYVPCGIFHQAEFSFEEWQDEVVRRWTVE